MKIHPGFVGIDVSKQSLDIFDGAVGTAERLDNAAEAISRLIGRWTGTEVFVLFEATGHYDSTLRHALSAAGIAFARVNPARARDFARATGCLAKTDAIDARMLAAMAQSLRPAPQATSCPRRLKLAALQRRRDQLVGCRKQELTRLEGCDDPDIKADITTHIASLGDRIKAIEARIRQLMRQAPGLGEADRLLRSIPGVGPVTAGICLALMPELGERSPKTIAALAGLAPFNVDSGQFRGQRSIRGGRRRVRQALYMAALSAVRSHRRFTAMFKAMLDAGKPGKLALVAIARKILTIANAVIRDKLPFQASIAAPHAA